MSIIRLSPNATRFNDPSDMIPNGSIINEGNFMQANPGTEICKDVKDVIVNGGNWTNCKIPESWIINGGNWVQKEFCSHQYPDWIDKGLNVCSEDCSHKSNEKEWIEITEKEYIELVDVKSEALKTDKEYIDIKIINQTDSATLLTKQTTEKLIYTYADAVTKSGSSAKKDRIKPSIIDIKSK